MIGPRHQCYIPSHKVIGPLVLEKRIFDGFLAYMGMVAILVRWPRHHKQIFVPPSHWGSIWNLALIGPSVLEKIFENGGLTDDGHRTDDRAYLYYVLTNEPKGSGKLKRIGSKTAEKRWRHHLSQLGLSVTCCHGNQSFDPICLKTICILSPTLLMLHIKFDQDWPTGFRDIQVQKCEIFVTQGQVTPKWVVWSGPKLNLTKLLWLSWLPATLMMIQ